MGAEIEYLPAVCRKNENKQLTTEKYVWERFFFNILDTFTQH
jgi:hypothetical protein